MSPERPASLEGRATRLEPARVAPYLVVSVVVLGAGFGAAWGAGRSGFDAATFALALLGALAAVTALLRLELRRRGEERLTGELRELLETQRRTLSDAAGRRPELRVLFLNGHAGTERARIVRRQPRPLDIEQTVAFERALALRTLPSAKSPGGSLDVYRKPTEHDREAFRTRVAEYAASLRDALERYDAYRRDRALLVYGRFRFENGGRSAAHDVTVSARFPDPFEAVGEAPVRPGLPQRPTFRAKRAALAALMGGDARRVAQAAASRPAASRASEGVTRPTYRPGSALVEVVVHELPPSVDVDMGEESGWLLRLPRAGEYRVAWEAACAELADPVRGELLLEVVDHLDETPICSIKELLADVGAEASDEVATFAPDLP